MTTEHTKSITTSIPTEIWKKAVMSDVRWTTALRMGIEALCGINKEKEKLKEDILQTEIRLKSLKEELKSIEAKEKEKDIETKKNLVLEEKDGVVTRYRY